MVVAPFPTCSCCTIWGGSARRSTTETRSSGDSAGAVVSALVAEVARAKRSSGVTATAVGGPATLHGTSRVAVMRGGSAERSITDSVSGRGFGELAGPAGLIMVCPSFIETAISARAAGAASMAIATDDVKATPRAIVFLPPCFAASIPGRRGGGERRAHPCSAGELSGESGPASGGTSCGPLAFPLGGDRYTSFGKSIRITIISCVSAYARQRCRRDQCRSTWQARAGLRSPVSGIAAAPAGMPPTPRPRAPGRRRGSRSPPRSQQHRVAERAAHALHDPHHPAGGAVPTAVARHVGQHQRQRRVEGAAAGPVQRPSGHEPGRMIDAPTHTAARAKGSAAKPAVSRFRSSRPRSAAAVAPAAAGRRGQLHGTARAERLLVGRRQGGARHLRRRSPDLGRPPGRRLARRGLGRRPDCERTRLCRRGVAGCSSVTGLTVGPCPFDTPPRPGLGASAGPTDPGAVRLAPRQASTARPQ